MCFIEVQMKNTVSYLNEAGILKDLVRVTDEFELLHYSHRLIQVQNDTCGCNAEISLQGEKGNQETKNKRKYKINTI